jgi:hypothetical protein
VSCVLKAAGHGFDVEAFLGASPFKAESVYQKGQANVSAEPVRMVAGFTLRVSGAGSDDLAGQVRDAIAFLDQFEEELRRLGRFPGVEEVSLGFGIAWRDVAVQTDTFPPELLWRAGALDIALDVSRRPAGAPEG